MLPSLSLEGEFGLNYDILLPYWEEVARVMKTQQYQNHVTKEFCVFEMEQISFTNVVMDVLRPSLQLNQLLAYAFSDNYFGRDGIKFVLDVIEHNSRLQRFTLINNIIDRQDDLDRLCDILRRKDSLEYVMIGRCGQPNSIDFLPLVMATEKVNGTVILNNNFISTGGNGRVLAESLSRRRAYQKKWGELNLFGNEVDDDDLLEFGIALEGNRQYLGCIDLGNNRITKKGVENFYQRTIFNQTSLNSVACSNHTCEVTFQAELQSPHSRTRYLHVNMLGWALDFADRQSLSPRAFVRRMKILAHLSPPYEDVKLDLLHGVPLALMPNVLWLLQRYPVNISHDERFTVWSKKTECINLWGIMSDQLLSNSYDVGNPNNYTFQHDDEGGEWSLEEATEWDRREQDMKKLSMTYQVMKGMVAGLLVGLKTTCEN